MKNNEVEGFIKVVNEMVELKKRKSIDYGSSWKALGLQGVLYKIATKFTRIWLNKDKTSNMANESFRDSLIDLAVYSIMAIQLLDGGESEDQIVKLLKQ